MEFGQSNFWHTNYLVYFEIAIFVQTRFGRPLKFVAELFSLKVMNLTQFAPLFCVHFLTVFFFSGKTLLPFSISMIFSANRVICTISDITQLCSLLAFSHVYHLT